MGGAGLTDQDVQDNFQDGHNSQDCQGDGQEDVGSRVGGRIAIQGAGTSPRSTGSGKIIKYKDE